MITQMPDLTVTGGAVSGPAAFAMAGVKHDDVDLLMGYDSFTITALLHLEDLGFCAKGEGGAFVEDGKLGPGGSLPMNTNGGGLSYTHPGMYGMFLLVEAVRQLRGEAGDRQLDRPPTSRSPTAPAACCRPWAPSCSGTGGRPCERAARRDERTVAAGGRAAGDRGQRPVLGRHPRAAPRAAVVHGDGTCRCGTRARSTPPSPTSPIEWREASGEGTVYAASVHHRPGRGATRPTGRTWWRWSSWPRACA